MKSKASKAMSLSKIERKAQIHEKKHLLKATWLSLSESSKKENAIEVLENSCSYTIQDRSIILHIPKREKPKRLNVSYDGLDDANNSYLANLGETLRLLYG